MNQQDQQLRDLLSQHLSPDVVDALNPDASPDHEGLLQRIRRRWKWRNGLAFALQTSFGVAMSITVVAFLKADNIHAEVMLSTVVVMLLVMAMTLCLVRFMYAHQTANRREVKRLELAIMLMLERQNSNMSDPVDPEQA
ncbi:MAG: DUF6768 family protein [Planctomycetota bacterium]